MYGKVVRYEYQHQKHWFNVQIHNVRLDKLFLENIHLNIGFGHTNVGI